MPAHSPALRRRSTPRGPSAGEYFLRLGQLHFGALPLDLALFEVALRDDVLRDVGVDDRLVEVRLLLLEVERLLGDVGFRLGVLLRELLPGLHDGLALRIEVACVRTGVELDDFVTLL